MIRDIVETAFKEGARMVDDPDCYDGKAKARKFLENASDALTHISDTASLKGNEFVKTRQEEFLDNTAQLCASERDEFLTRFQAILAEERTLASLQFSKIANRLIFSGIVIALLISGTLLAHAVLR